MAESSTSSSDSSIASSSDTSDGEETLEGECLDNEIVPFVGIQPWRFEPQGRNNSQMQATSSEENTESAVEPRRRRDMDSEEW